jgi:hypothetical protein
MHQGTRPGFGRSVSAAVPAAAVPPWAGVNRADYGLRRDETRLVRTAATVVVAEVVISGPW